MANTGTPSIKRPSSKGPVRSMLRSDTRVIITFTVGVYATGGNPLTLPTTDMKGGVELVGVNLLTASPDVTADRVFAWDGSTTAPKITCRVISTAAQLGNGIDLSAVTLTAELIYGA